MNENRSVKYGVAIPSQAIVDTTAVNGNAVDRRNYDITEFVANIGTPSADDTVSLKVQDTDEDPASIGNPLAAGWADLAGASIAAIAVAGQKVIQVTRRKGKAFLRLVATCAGTSISIPVAASYALRGGQTSHPETAPDVAIGSA